MSISQLNANFYPQSRHENLLVQNLTHETLVYDLNSNKAYCLNPTAAAVWFQCNGQNNLHQIVDLIKLQNKIDSNEELVLLSINELHKNDLLIETPGLNTVINQVDRRGMIRRLAIGTALVLPVISSLVAPTAAQAASGSISGSCRSDCTLDVICFCGPAITPCPSGYDPINVTAGICVAANVNAPITLTNVKAGGQVCLVAGVCLIHN